MKIVFNEKTWHLICIWSFAGRFVLNLFEYIYHNVGHGGLEQSIQKQTEMGIVLAKKFRILYIIVIICDFPCSSDGGAFSLIWIKFMLN